MSASGASGHGGAARGHGGSERGHGGADRGHHHQNRPGQSDRNAEKKPKETLFDLARYLDKVMHVKFVGGREASGTLKGYDALLNLVLDCTTELPRGDSDEPTRSEEKRELGLVVCRGPSIVMLCPEGMEPISNPFVSAADGE
ncbi:hypothetical protein RvY_13893 [Ramazzottius varieornatus]|uniref:Sm domain-containing protein n=1 Tax=Ramazzottius varieornatus TaxID=947166 RepID=A0A1D1VWV4_RAMVA|nr:hypothetical protein RvY_13893 [Ramazzottius varieornatus]